MANSNVNTAWKNDLYPLVKKTYDFSYEEFMSKLLQIVSEIDSKSIDYRMAGLGGYGELPAYDGTQLTSLNQKRGFVTIINPAERGGAIDITRRYANTDLSGEAQKVGRRAARTTAMTVQLALLRMFGKFADSSQLGGDGKAWGATDHPIASKGDAGGVSTADADAGTYSNLITSALSVSAITTAQTLANRFVTPDGLPIGVDMQDSGILLVSPELEPKAIEICGKDAKMSPMKLPETAENGANPVYGLKYMVIGGGNEGFSAKQWAIADMNLLKETTGIVYIERPSVLRTELDNPLIDRYVPYVDFGVGFGDSRSIIFSNPS